MDEKFLKAIESFHNPVIDLLGIIIVILGLVIVGLFWFGVQAFKGQTKRCEERKKTKEKIITDKDVLIEKKNTQLTQLAIELTSTSENAINAISTLKDEQKELIRKIDNVLQNQNVKK